MLMVFDRFEPHWNVKIDGEGILLIMFTPWGVAFWFLRVGGWGVSLSDSSLEGSSATWAPGIGQYLFILFMGKLTHLFFPGFLINFWAISHFFHWGRRVF